MSQPLVFGGEPSLRYAVISGEVARSLPGQYGQSESPGASAFGRINTQLPRVGSFLSSSTVVCRTASEARRPRPVGGGAPDGPRQSLSWFLSFRRCWWATSTQSFSLGSCDASEM